MARAVQGTKKKATRNRRPGHRGRAAAAPIGKRARAKMPTEKLLHEIALAPEQSAELASLRYVSDKEPGIRRLRAGKGFRYVGPDGRPIRAPREVERIQKLAIPPAWTKVWICTRANGHLQATGRDAKGRKQYRYHADWRRERDETKYTKMIAFGMTLPVIRGQVERDLDRPGLPKEKVLATVVKLLETTLIRVGNDEYAKANASYGLTTLRDQHVAVRGAKLSFRFKGKSGKEHEIDLKNERLAKVVKRCRDLPGQELFQYRDEGGELRSVDSSDVNSYLQETAGDVFTAKDFRTWAGTVLAATTLQDYAAFDSATEAKRNLNEAVATVAARLGNTKAICRKCYIHPAIIESYLDGTLGERLKTCSESEIDASLKNLRPEEAAVLVFLEQYARAS